MRPRERTEVGHPGRLRALARMEEALEDPLPCTALALSASILVRSLERLFRAHLGRSIGSHDVALRLDHARHLLRRTPLSMAETALA